MMLGIWADLNEKFNEITAEFRDFIVENTRNPFLWVGIIVLGLLVFEFTYKALHKD